MEEMRSYDLQVLQRNRGLGEDMLLIRLTLFKATAGQFNSSSYEECHRVAVRRYGISFSDMKRYLSSSSWNENGFTRKISETLTSMGVPHDLLPAIFQTLSQVVEAAVSAHHIDVGVCETTYLGDGEGAGAGAGGGDVGGGGGVGVGGVVVLGVRVGGGGVGGGDGGVVGDVGGAVRAGDGDVGGGGVGDVRGVVGDGDVRGVGGDVGGAVGVRGRGVGGMIPAIKSSIDGLEQVTVDITIITHSPSCSICLEDFAAFVDYQQEPITRLPADIIIMYIALCSGWSSATYVLSADTKCQLKMINQIEEGAKPALLIDQNSTPMACQESNLLEDYHRKHP
ncbi:uncharacterized protein LOC133726622 [Rosa rugosa]|uniref:uncharacterized protein LOC133726622 n=1 Tax=Rosa rugosa TaxID=74645 RepID=UPI002B408A98|nr:uncharacterized protein LOC133726622 [Rosa rugosa]